MACLEHECADCGLTAFNNVPTSRCPKCGGTDIRTTWDEQFDHGEAEAERDEGDGE